MLILIVGISIIVPFFAQTSPALKKSWLRAWVSMGFFSCQLGVDNLKEKKLPAQGNRNCFDLILARHY